MTRFSRAVFFFASAVLASLSLTAAFSGPAGATGAYGPDTCKQGYVWREANADDTVCVTPAERSRNRLANQRASRNWKPGGGDYGQFTCRNGYVWREAFEGDVVCVTPEARERVRADNAVAATRYEE
jgi:hypothetical protein